jgi:hypothetical protein
VIAYFYSQILIVYINGVTSACAFPLLASALQPDVFQPQMQFVNLQIYLGTLV